MKHDVLADTWVAIDALGRTLPDHAECGSPRPDRFVGVFYFLTHGQHVAEGPNDVTRTISERPGDPQFLPNTSYYWGEPEMGYYLATDRWAIRRSAYMLADAGIDTLIFDTTNDATYPDVVDAICETYRAIRAEGESTPDVCFLASRESINQVWDRMYSRGLHEDLWFRWQGKPLLLFGQHRGMPREDELPADVRQFFTLRASWAWDSLPWYGDEGRRRWPWVAHYPQPVGWEVKGVAEQVPVTIGQHPLSNIGRSFHSGRQPETDDHDLTPYTSVGLCFEEQWKRALEVDPQFVFVTGWNEWTAGSVVCDADEATLHERWSFFPGARMTRAGRPLTMGDVYFIDQYNREYSRDAEPMAGGHTDNYYYQLWANVRRYKGVRAPEPASPPKPIVWDGPFSQWDDVGPEYRDHVFETLERDEQGYGSVGRYVNRTGRNEFVRMKVARNAESIAFLAETREPITPATDCNWMMLFLNVDGRRDTGWQGYDYLINWPVINGGFTTVKRSAGGWTWDVVGQAMYYLDGNRLVVTVPRKLIGCPSDPISIDFKWADNIAARGDVAEFFTQGDTAPARRAAYRYSTG